MAITLNSVNQAATAGSASFSVAHTVNAGTNRLMLVFVECPNTNDYMETGTVSYGGASLGTAVVLPPATPALALFTYVYRMIAPPVGTANVVVTPSVSAYLNVKVITLDGVDQTTPISASNAVRLGYAPGSTYSLPITAPVGGAAVGSFSCRNTSSAIAAINGATELGTITGTTVSRMISSIKDAATSLDYSFTGSNPSLAASAVALNAASGGGTPPTGTVTIGTITPNSTGASAPFTYSAADQTGFEYRINGGTAVAGTNSPQVVSGLTPSTAYTIEIRAINASGQGAWSTAANFTTSAATAAISFSGTIPAQTFTNGQAVSVNLATYFTGTLTPFTFANTGTSLTGTGLSITSAGLLSGTATTGSVSGVVITGTDASSNTAASNAFNVTVNAASVPVSFGGTIPAITGTQNTAITPVNTSTYFTGSLTPFTYSLFSGTLPSGVTLNSSTGIISGTPTVSFSGNIVVRATDTGSNVANSNSIAVNIAAAAGTITSQPLTRNNGTAPGVVSLSHIDVRLQSTGALIIRKTGVSTNGSSVFTLSDAAITTGSTYIVSWLESGGEFGIAYNVVAS